MKIHSKEYLLKNFSKQEKLLFKKYNSLFGICTLYGIDYAFINRCYKRYKNWCKDNLLSYNKDIFQHRIKVFIVAQQEEYKFNKNTYGEEVYKIAKISGFSDYMWLYTNNIFKKSLQED